MSTVMNSWRATLFSSLDWDSTCAEISPIRAAELEKDFVNGKPLFLTVQAGFDVEIVKIVSITENILTMERGQQGTQTNVWPAGTPIEARITAKAIDDLRLDLNIFLANQTTSFLAPNGDLITKTI
jgi:hypothetical protein